MSVFVVEMEQPELKKRRQNENDRADGSQGIGGSGGILKDNFVMGFSMAMI